MGRPHLLSQRKHLQVLWALGFINFVLLSEPLNHLLTY